MLVLTRKLQQQIKIGDQITVTVLRVKGNTVRIGVAAPRDVRVVRAELPKDPPAEATPLVIERLASDAKAEGEALVEREDSDASQPAGCNAPAPRLPQLRPFDRYGAAPLKQLVASSVLAK